MLPQCSKRVAHIVQDVRSVFSPLAVKTRTVNLGQRFPNFPPPAFIKDAACQAIQQDALNQYAHPWGFYLIGGVCGNMAGANEAIYATLCAYLSPGDECIIMEPFFDQYEPNITLNGGVPVYVPLRLQSLTKSESGCVTSVDWKLNIGELKSKITSKSKVLILNTPHNPIGKVFTTEELLAVGKVAIDHNLLILADEVYERLVYEPAKHVRIVTLSKELWDRTITIGSAGKIFAVTGWRLGWAIGLSSIVANVLNAHTRIMFCANAPLQEAVASALNTAIQQDFYTQQLIEYDGRRQKPLTVFQEIGLACTVPEGSYFFLVDTSRIRIPDEEWDEVCRVPIPNTNHDWRVCYWLTTKIGVAVIPSSSFYSNENANLASHLARLCFCKTDETLNEAVSALRKLKQYIQ